MSRWYIQPCSESKVPAFLFAPSSGWFSSPACFQQPNLFGLCASELSKSGLEYFGPPLSKNRLPYLDSDNIYHKTDCNKIILVHQRDIFSQSAYSDMPPGWAMRSRCFTPQTTWRITPHPPAQSHCTRNPAAVGHRRGGWFWNPKSLWIVTP